MQRVAREIVERLPGAVDVIAPREPLNGAKGHIWDQLALPGRVDGRLLWSPCNTGSLLVEKQVVTVHDAAVFDCPSSFTTPYFREVYRQILPRLVKRIRHVTTVSEFSKQRLCERLDLRSNQIDVIWNGVDSSFRPQSAEQVDRVTESLGLRPQGYFAVLSTIEPRKNLKLTAEAWRRARAGASGDLADVKLVIIGGSGPSTIFGRSDVGDNAEGVVLTGYLPDQALPALLSGAIGLLFPSLYEGFGLPIVEAMACGAPVVTTRCGSMPEVAADAALYVDALDPDDLAAALVRLRNDPSLRAELTARGIERAKLFSWDIAAAKYQDVFARFS